VENTGPRDGTEVVQVYVSSPNVDDGLERPPRVLAGFRSVALAAGDAKTVTVPLHAQALKRYDRDDGWTLDPGPCTVHVGRSSRDLRASVSVPRYDLLRE
jgi:beta-glucosidase